MASSSSASSVPPLVPFRHLFDDDDEADDEGDVDDEHSVRVVSLL